MSQKNYRTVIALFITISALFTVFLRFSTGEDAQLEADTVDDGNSPESPMIIWFHNAAVVKPYILEKALSSGVITHVIIAYLNPDDAPLQNQKKVMDAISVCRSNNAKIIWCRALWPIYNVEGWTETRLTDPNYYKSIIQTIFSEAKILGAEYTAIDIEPYGHFPYIEMFWKPLGKEKFKAMQDAVKIATDDVGKFDFVLPVGGAFKYQMYDAIIGIGKYRIAEHTYFDIPAKLRDKKRPYDVLGAYISVRKENAAYPEAPYFTAQEILERQKLWSSKKGLMLYSKEDEVEAVAEQISKIKVIVPRDE